MATKKLSTKAKTQTRTAAARSTRSATSKAKTTSTRNTGKTSPASTAKADTKAASKSAVVVRTSSVRNAADKLRQLHQINAGLFILLALAAGYLIKDTTFNVTIGHLTKDDLASKTATVFASAAHGIYDVNIRWVVVALMVMAAVLPLLWVFRWRRQYEVNVEAAAMPQRWLEMGILSAIMLATVALLSGVRDVMTLVVIAGLMIVAGGLGWLGDKQNRQAVRPDWSAYTLATVTASLPLLLIAVAAVATYFYGLVRSPWYVYALYLVTLVGFGLVAYNQRQHYKRANQWKFAVVERNYTLISLLVKAAFAIVLIVGLHR